MTKKFTEEQYQQIIEIADEYFPYTILYPNYDKGFMDILYEQDKNIYELVSYEDLEEKVIAIVNKLTREWAHEQFVEKEKKYVWYLKDNNFYRLTNHGGATQVNISHSTEDELTESEVKKWGYNPEMFDKEEV